MADDRTAATELDMSILMLELLLHWFMATCFRYNRNQLDLDVLLYLPVRRVENYDPSVLSHVLRESIPLLSTRNDLQKLGRMGAYHEHQVIFVVRQKNIYELAKKLLDASNPEDRNFGRHLSSEEVARLTSNPESRNQVISNLNAIGATVISETLNGEYITANAPIAVWERLFRTKFFTFRQTLQNGDVLDIVRAEEYWIPTNLDMHVESVFRTIEFPYDHIDGVTLSNVPIDGCDKGRCRCNPERALDSSNLTHAHGSNSSTQGLLLFDRHCTGTSDIWHNLSAQNQSGEAAQTKSIGRSSCHPYDSDDVLACRKSAYDLQYLMSSSPGSPTTYWSPDHSFTDWLVDIANMPSPPLVLTIGQAVDERSVTDSVHRAFTTQAIKLSAMGVTIVASSAVDSICATQLEAEASLSDVRCQSRPTFPSSNPFVTSVGIAPVSFDCFLF